MEQNPFRSCLSAKGAFNNYVDQILPNFDHLPRLSKITPQWSLYIHMQVMPTLCSSDEI